jgi:predicted RNA-binding protein with PIN domain
MPYLIDGHNLVPKISGMSLKMLDDEDRLIEMLQLFARVRRQRVEVFFDQAPPTRGGKKMAGMVSVHYVRTGKTADQAIVERLRQLGKSARNWTVVTSDRQVRAEARERESRLASSEEFAAQLQMARQEAQTTQKENPAPPGPDELEEWLRLFGKH